MCNSNQGFNELRHKCCQPRKNNVAIMLQHSCNTCDLYSLSKLLFTRSVLFIRPTTLPLVIPLCLCISYFSGSCWFAAWLGILLHRMLLAVKLPSWVELYSFQWWSSVVNSLQEISDVPIVKGPFSLCLSAFTKNLEPFQYNHLLKPVVLC